MTSRIVATFLTVLIGCTTSTLAGDLTPPVGPVAPTGKTLVEIEPRIAINPTNTPGDADSLFRINQPGSYYLTGNIAGQPGFHGIKIATPGVTLDLNGFSLIGVAGSLNGILMPTFQENTRITNGSVRSWGLAGIAARVDVGSIDHIIASGNGGWGIDNTANSTFTTVVSDCQTFSNGLVDPNSGGIRGGSGATIRNCTAFDNMGTGIKVSSFSIVENCLAAGNSGDGINCTNAALVADCVASANFGDGIEVAGDSLVRNNICDGNGVSSNQGAGIHVTNSDNRIEGNNCTDADRGIDIDAAGNFVTRNVCSGNTVNWDVVAGNFILVVNATASGAINGNSGGVSSGSTDPNANFSY